MLSRLLIAIACTVLSLDSAVAEEYLLQVETVSYEDLPVDEQHDDWFHRDDLEGGRVLNSIEVHVSSGGRFHGKTTIGDESVVLTGDLEPMPEQPGQFAISLRHACYREDADDVDASGQPRREGSTLQSKITVAVGQRLRIAGMNTVEFAEGQPDRKMMTRLEIELRKYDPPVEQEAQQRACPPSKSSQPISRLSMSTR